jgi:transketolase
MGWEVFLMGWLGLGEDGPTHQPIEQIASLRAIPGAIIIRPADANETSYAWLAAIEHKEGPVAIILTRQGLQILDQEQYPSAKNLLKGAYTLKDSKGTPELILIASGSEVGITLKAAGKLQSDGVKVRVVSFPSWELFEQQPKEYKDSVLPSSVKARVAIEAGVGQGWEKYIGDNGEIISIEKFGASAPIEVLMEKFGFTTENIIGTAQRVLKHLKSI